MLKASRELEEDNQKLRKDNGKIKAELNTRMD
jgi:hypothetical protein